MSLLKKRWKLISLMIIVLMMFTTVTAFASSENLSKDVNRNPRLYYVGEEVVFDAKIVNSGDTYTNTYYYIQDVFEGNLDYVTIYRDGNGDDTISFDGSDNLIAPDYELILGTNYLIDNGKIILRWIDGDGDPTHVLPGTLLEEEIPIFPGEGDATLELEPGVSSYIEMHYIIQPEDVGTVYNEINTLGEDTAPDKLSADVTAFFKVISPDTEVTILPSESIVYAGDTVDLTITEANTGNDPLTNVYVELWKDGVLQSDTLDSTTEVSGDLDSDGELDVGETWTWEVNGVTIDADTDFKVLGFGTDSLGNMVSYDEVNEKYLGEMAEIDISTISPDTMVGITASETEVYAGDTVDLTITEKNTGDDPLTDVYVELWKDGVLQSETLDSTTEVSGDLNSDGVLDAGETWTWEVNGVTIDADTDFKVLGFGTDSLGNMVSYDEVNEKYLGEMAEIDISTISPDTMVGITASETEVYAGDTVDLTITEKNTGDDPLTDVYVELWKDGVLQSETLDSTTEVSGDLNSDGVLDAGETWTWEVNGVTIDADTDFKVLGFGTDSLGNMVSYDEVNEKYLGEMAEIDISIISPDTMVGITASETEVYAGDTVDLTITEKNTGDDPLTDVYVELWKDGVLQSETLDSTTEVSGDLNSDGVLDAGETWTWEVNGVTIDADTDFKVLGFGTDSLGNMVSYDEVNEKYLDEMAEIDISIISPDTMVGITASETEVYAGDTVDLTITEKNTGDDPLTDVYVELWKDGVLQSETLDSTTEVSGDLNSDGVLDAGETWTWEVNGVTIDADTDFKVLGFGTDSLGNMVSYDEVNEKYLDEMAEIDISIISPDTMVGITASETEVYAGDTVDLTITEKNTGDDPLTDVYVELWKDGVLQSETLDSTTEVSGDLNSDGVLDAGETWTWEVNGVTIDADTDFKVLGFGTDSLGNMVSYDEVNEKYLDEMAEIDISTISPDTMVGITASETIIPYGDTVDLTITEENTGDDPLSNVYVELMKNGSLHSTLDMNSANLSGDTNDDGILDVGEMWTWIVTVPVNADIDFEVFGFGTDSLDNVISYANGYMGEMDAVSVMVEMETMEETAWGYNPDNGEDATIDNGFAIPFNTLGKEYGKFNNWGWTNGPNMETTSGSAITLDLYAAAGRNELSNGVYAGTVEIKFNGDGTANVVYDTIYEMTEIHFYIGDTVLPMMKNDKYTNAPGQFEHSEYFMDGEYFYEMEISLGDWDDFYIAAHAVVQVPMEY